MSLGMIQMSTGMQMSHNFMTAVYQNADVKRLSFLQ